MSSKRSKRTGAQEEPSRSPVQPPPPGRYGSFPTQDSSASAYPQVWDTMATSSTVPTYRPQPEEIRSPPPEVERGSSSAYYSNQPHPTGENLEYIEQDETRPGRPSYTPQIMDSTIVEPESSTDSGGDDYGYLYDTDTQTITESLTSEVRDYKFEYGRRYHAYREGSWVVPNDETQQEQMDIFHEIYNAAKGGYLFIAPITPNPQRILDLGTGTGIWAMDVADMFPKAMVIGNDLSPIQPNQVPPNCSFEVDDFNSEWTYAPNSFDLVYARAIHGAVESWPFLLNNAYRVLKPGGWIEISSEDVDFFSNDGTLKADNVLHVWNRNAKLAFDKMGKVLQIAPHMRNWLIEAGFDLKTIVQAPFKLPIGTWPKRKEHKLLGAMFLYSMLMGVEGFVLGAYTRVLGYDVEWTKQHIEDIKAAMKNRKCHAYMIMNVWYAQKPERMDMT